MDNSLVISCAIVGAELTKEVYPNLPTTPDEIAAAAEESVKAGASIIHLHVRDEEGKPTQRVDVFEEVTEKIRNRCDCVLQYSTGGAVGTPLEGRYAPLSLKPDMATLSMGTMNFGPDIYENSENTIETISEAIMENKIMPELEVFDYGMMDTVERFVKAGKIPAKYHMDFVLGVPGGMAANIKNLILLTDRLAKGQSWAVAAMGRHQLPLTTHAIAMGGHVRVGIEDNIYFRKGEMVTSNAQLVERAVRIAKELDRPVADVNKAKELLGM
jgi:3-keto-5-aminohexanoate cleavage enzyme